MRISSISITNFEGIPSLQVTLPPVALISGDNGTGKTSFTDAIKYTYGRGHNPDVIHTGADVAEVIITHDDESQVKARASRKTNETTRSWKAPGAKRFVITREQIDAIANAVSYDPLAFLEKTEKEQMATLLAIMPPKVTPEELIAAVGDAAQEASQAEVINLNGLEQIRVVEKAIYDARRTRNVAADTQEKHASELEAALPPVAESGNWEAEAKRLAAEIKALQDKQAAEIKELGDSLQATKDREGGVERTEHTAAEQEYAEAVAAAERRRAERRAQATKKASDAIEYARGIANTEGSRIKAEITPKIDALARECTVAQERARSEVQAGATRKAAEVARQHAAADRSRSTVLTAALERLGVLREAVAARLPIPGITFAEGRILDKTGVPLCKWNEEAAMRLALRIGVLAHGSCGFIVMDKSNGIVGKKWEGVLKTAKKYADAEGLQFILARAEPGRELTVEEVK